MEKSGAIVKAQARNKHFILDQSRLKKAQEILGTRTETETIERALDRIITDEETDRLAWTAHEEFLKEMVEGNSQIIDVFGRLDGK